jgi:hypothetical protein
MRLLAAPLLVLAVSTNALAQEGGSVALDAMTTSGRHFGMGFYVTERLSLRPSLGFGYADGYGAVLNLGTDARFELMPARRVSPYLTAGFNYQRNPYLVQFDSGGALVNGDTDVARFGAGLGLRTRLKYGISLVGEGRVMNSSFQEIPGSLLGQEALRPGAHFEAALGLSYVFN